MTPISAPKIYRLLSCPFCGGKAYWVQSGPPQGIVVRCGSCSARTVSDDGQRAVDEWNLRVAPTMIDRGRDALMATEAERKELRRMVDESEGLFAGACRDPNITREDYDKLREQYQTALHIYHEAMGLA